MTIWPRVCLLAACAIALAGCDPAWWSLDSTAGEALRVETVGSPFPRGAGILGSVYGAPSGGDFAIILLDSHGRICGDIYGKARSGGMGFRIALADPVDCGGRVMAIDLARPERRASARFVLASSPRDWEGFPLVAAPADPGSRGETWARFRRLGARFAATSPESAIAAAFEGLRPLPLEMLGGHETLGLSQDTWRRCAEAFAAGRGAPNLRIRPHCPASPEEREAIRKVLRDRSIALREAGAAGASLAREPAICPPELRIEFCLCPGCHEWLVRELRRRYTKTEVLSTAWETAVTGWEGLVPPPLDECLARAAGGHPRNVSPWCDHRSETDSCWADSLAFLRGFIREFAVDMPVGFVGGRPPEAFAGYDWEKLLSWPDWAAPPADDVTSGVARAANRRNIPLLGMASASGREGVAQVWKAVLQQRSGLIIEGAAAADESVWAEAASAAAGTAELIGRAELVASGVGIFWSHRALQVRTAAGMGEAGSVPEWLRCFERLGVSPRIVLPDDLPRARESGISLIALPKAIAISRREAAEIRQFVEQGGTVVADGYCGLFDGSGVESSPKGALDELFGVARTREAPAQPPPSKMVLVNQDRTPAFLDGVAASGLIPAEVSLRAVTAYPRAMAGPAPVLLMQQVGAGRAAYLNIELGSRGSSADETRLIANLLELAGIGRGVRVWSGGAENSNALRRRYRLGAMEMVAVWDPALRGRTRAVVDLGRTAFVYDVMDGTFLSQTSRPTVELCPEKPTILACLDSMMTGVSLRLYERGGRVEYIASSDDAGPGRDRVFRLDVFTPSGVKLDHYSSTTLARDGRAVGAFTPALNEPAGPWTVRLTDVATGHAVTDTFLKREIRFEGLFPPEASGLPRREEQR